MTEFAARIRSVRSKDGKVVALHNPMPNDGENWRGKMIEHAKGIAENEGNIDGFIVLALWDDGKRSLGYRMSSRIPREFLPSYIAEIVRTDIVTEWQAENTFNDKFEWVES